MRLKPCPFCGGEAKVVIGSIVELWQHAVECKDCGANTGYKWGICPSVAENKAIEAWNRRKPLEDIVEQLEEASYWTEPTYDEDGYSYDDEIEVIDLSVAIEIVKTAGVDNE